MGVYEVAILGSATEHQRQVLQATLDDQINDFGLRLGEDVVLHDARTIHHRNPRAAFAAAYFGGAESGDEPIASELVASSQPVVPVISSNGDFVRDVPAFMQTANGIRLNNDDPSMQVLASALMECIGLLRRQRRVFVSYRRPEARAAALQLHDLLSSKGFDVFLDTHDIRPGDPFQDVLWHRLCDSDVMVMLDTPSYFDSKWTRQELGRALSKEIHVLRVIWPEHKPTKMMDLAETIYLEPAELVGADGPLAEEAAQQIALAVENLRSRSIAARYMSFTGRLRADAERVGARVDGVGAHRAISITLMNENRVWAYPVVGVPTAETLNDVAHKARQANQGGIPILVYDSIGIRDTWSTHLKWLEENIKVVRSMKLSEAAWTLSGLED